MQITANPLYFLSSLLTLSGDCPDPCSNRSGSGRKDGVMRSVRKDKNFPVMRYNLRPALVFSAVSNSVVLLFSLLTEYKQSPVPAWFNLVTIKCPVVRYMEAVLPPFFRIFKKILDQASSFPVLGS